MYNIKTSTAIREIERMAVKKGYIVENLENKNQKEKVKPLFSYARCNHMTAGEIDSIFAE